MWSSSRTLTCLALLSGLLTACSGVTPTQALNAEDRKLLVTVRANALENARTGQATNWSNPKTGNRGTIVLTRTYKSGDADCREFQQTTTVAGETDLAYGASCRAPDGTWIIVDEPIGYRPGDDPLNRHAYDYQDGWYSGYPYYHYGHRYRRW